MPSISIVLRKDKSNKKNEAPIHFRIIKNRKVSYISSGIAIPVENWDFHKNKIKNKQLNSARLNSYITNKFAELQDSVYQHETISKSTTIRQLKEKIYGKRPEDFIVFANEVVEDYKDKGAIGTYFANKSALNTFKEFAGERNLMFQDITVELLTKYEKHLKHVKELKVNTVHRHLKFVRKIFNDAVRLEKVEHQHNPFLKFKLKLEKTTRTFLTDEELKAIENVKTRRCEKMDLHKQMFIFAAYTGGLRISDILKLQWKYFDGSHIHIAIHKTKTQLSIKLPNKAIEIINRYRRRSKSANFIFPILPDEIDMNNPIMVHKEISRATAYINKNLKTLAQEAEIDKPISFHTSRHTWATRALRKGISIDKVSKLMGHAQLRETQIYAKIVNEELDKAMDVFND